MLKLRPISDNDCRLLWEWVNEPQSRAFAFNSEAISWDEHSEWFRKKRSDPDCLILILTDEQNSPVGQVRFDMEPGDKAEIAITIASGYRGLGYGVECIRLACEYLRRRKAVAEVIAHIKLENTVSIQAFRKAGFAPTREVQQVKGQEALKLVWHCPSLQLPSPLEVPPDD